MQSCLRQFWVFTLALPLSLTLALIAAPEASATGLAVPTAARMVREADIIAVGRLRIEGDRVSLVAGDALKGALPPTLRLETATAPPGTEFDLRSHVESLGTQTCVILAKRLAAQAPEVADLPWLGAGIWPSGYDQREFPGGDVESCRRFVAAILGYEKLLRSDPSQTADRLLRDARDRTLGPAVIGFVDAFLDEASGHSALRRDLLTVLAARVAQDRDPDPYVIRNLASVAPELPSSLALSIFARATTAADAAVRDEAMTQGRAILRAHRFIGRDDCRSVADLQAAAERHGPALLRADATKALTLFDSPIPALRDSGNLVMQTLMHTVAPEIERPPANIGVEGARAFWSNRVRTLEIP